MELLPALVQQFFDDNGDPLDGGLLYSYISGTSTPLGTYTDASGDTPNANPVELDSSGRAPIWIAASYVYKFVLKTSAGVTLWTIDNVNADLSADADSAWTEHAITNGQSATNLSGETVDFALYSSADYDVEIIRGTTVIANGKIAVQNLNGTGRVSTGLFIQEGAHGVTFSVSQAALVAQLKAATDSGAGAGTIKLRRRLVPV